ncbi:MAG: hypothetical protein IJC93_10915 [Clostridia bacterium]|nr:hypothetical protein [Clostridia bacterium]
MEFWLGILFSVVFVVGAVVSAVLIRKSRKWIIGTVLCTIFAIVFTLYSVLTAVLFGI